MSFATVLNQLMKDNNTSNLALGKAIGISDTGIIKWKKGEASPSLDNALAIAKFFGVSLDDLAESNMTSGQSYYVRIPVMGTVSVYGIYTNDFWTDEYVTVERKELHGYPSEECYALRVRDDSLPQKYTPNISYIIFHQQKQCADGDYVIVQKQKSDEFLYKKFSWKGDTIELSAPHVQTLVCKKQDINKLCIHAVAIGDYLDV